MDDYHLTFASVCLDLGLHDQCLKYLANLDAHPDEEGAERSELWSLKSFVILNIGFLCTGELAKRLAFAERYLALNALRYPISWGICTCLCAMATSYAEQGDLDEANRLIRLAWQKFDLLIKLDPTEVNRWVVVVGWWGPN